MKDEDIRLNMKVKLNMNNLNEENELYLILKERNQSYAYVHKKVSDNPPLYILKEDINEVHYIHLFYDVDFDSYTKEDRKIKLQKICLIKEIK